MARATWGCDTTGISRWLFHIFPIKHWDCDVRFPEGQVVQTCWQPGADAAKGDDEDRWFLLVGYGRYGIPCENSRGMISFMLLQQEYHLPYQSLWHLSGILTIRGGTRDGCIFCIYLTWQEVELSAQHSVELDIWLSVTFELNQLEGCDTCIFWLFWVCATILRPPILYYITSFLNWRICFLNATMPDQWINPTPLNIHKPNPMTFHLRLLIIPQLAVSSKLELPV